MSVNARRPRCICRENVHIRLPYRTTSGCSIGTNRLHTAVLSNPVRLQPVGAQYYLVPALDPNLLVAEQRLAAEHSHRALVGVEIVEALFQQSGLRTSFIRRSAGSGCKTSSTSSVASPRSTATSVFVKLGEIIFTALASPSRRKTPGVKSTSALP